MSRASAISVLVLLTLFAPESLFGLESPKTETMKPALLVIDVQNEFLPAMSEQDKKTSFDYINGAIRRFHDRGFPVIRIYQSGPKQGSEAFEFPKSVLVRPEDPMIIKEYSNAFNKTGLERLLRDKGCNVLFLCGLSAPDCVLATYLGAQDLDFDVFLIREALISPDSGATRFVAGWYETVSYAAMKVMIKYAQN